MLANHVNETIELTKTEAKKASQIGTDLYNQLVETKANFPTYKVVITTTKSKRTDTLKGLNYDFMEKYLTIHGTKDQIDEFNTYRSKDEMGITLISYGAIKQWFLAQFPEILNKRKELKAKIAASVSTTKKEIA